MDRYINERVNASKICYFVSFESGKIKCDKGEK